VKFWSADRLRSLPSFADIHSKHFNRLDTAVIIGAVPLLKGIAETIGAEWIKPEGATGDLSTDYKAKAEAALDAIKHSDIVILHIEACDWASHHRDPMAKMQAIESIDKEILNPLLNYLHGLYESDRPESTHNLFNIAVMSDHPSLCSTGNHTSGLSPLLFFHPHLIPDNTQCFSEREAAKGWVKSINEIYER
ncbi:MAG: hypothetical protein K2G53_05470, partial [Muribaculaceae bacterium]|nr:hypothetical protein [Muribaculaceae bacterium]